MTNSARRQFLYYGAAIASFTGLGSLVACDSKPGAAAAVASPPALVPPSPAFLTLSRTLTGYADPNPLLAQRLYAELLRSNPALETSLPLIAEQLAKSATAADAFADAPALRETFQQMLSGWYLGVLGSHDAPRCIAFENIASYRVVQKSLAPPSYCSGEANFWVKAPV